MSVDERVELIREQMLADGNDVSLVQLRSGPAVVGYKSKFRWRWLATKVHLFTVVVGVPQATNEVLAALTSQALEYAKTTKGKLRGLQTGVAVIPVVVATDVTPEARSTVESRPEKGFAAFVLPAIVDAQAEQTYSYHGRVIWGGMYASWMKERLARTLAPRNA